MLAAAPTPHQRAVQRSIGSSLRFALAARMIEHRGRCSQFAGGRHHRDPHRGIRDRGAWRPAVRRVCLGNDARGTPMEAEYQRREYGANGCPLRADCPARTIKVVAALRRSWRHVDNAAALTGAISGHSQRQKPA